MKFSIIIPVYNVESYLEKCIQSILQQKYKDIELLLIDDGSEDNSGKICDKYVEIDERIKIVHQVNKGVSVARNVGIKMAKGDYIVFVDSDDYILSDDFLDKIYEKIKESNADIIVYGCRRISEKTGEIVEYSYSNLENVNHVEIEDRISWLIEHDKFSSSSWMHIVKIEYLKDNKLFFDEGYKTSEDLEWIIRVMSYNPKIIGVNDTSYVYRIREGSLCTTEKKPYFWENRYNVIRKSEQIVNDENLSIKYKHAMLSYIAYLYYILLAEIIDEPNDQIRKAAFACIEKYRWIMKYSIGRKNKICRFIISIFGLKFGSKILHIRIAQRRKKV